MKSVTSVLSRASEELIDVSAQYKLLILLFPKTTLLLPVVIEPDGYNAILSGRSKKKPTLDFLPENHQVKEGDKVLLDGCPALIVKIGYSETVFGVYGKDGYTWRYVPNTRIEYLKLEKIVDPELHRDTDQEKAQRIIDAIQDANIEANQQEITKIKNGDK